MSLERLGESRRRRFSLVDHSLRGVFTRIGRSVRLIIIIIHRVVERLQLALGRLHGLLSLRDAPARILLVVDESSSLRLLLRELGLFRL